ncbi:MAG: hypothetical protein ABEK75_11720 [Salinibacter sp.]
MVAGIGTFGLFLTIMAWGLIVQGNSPEAFAVGGALAVAVVTSGFVAVPYMLGSLVARVAGRPWWIVGACAAAALFGLSFRIYLHVTDGGGQAFINMILHTAPYSTLVAIGWAASLWQSVFQAGGFGEKQAPSTALTGAVTVAVLLGVGGSAVGYMLRNSTLWFKVGVPMVLVALGLGLWAVRRAGTDRDRP